MARAEGECGGRARSANVKPAFVGRACISAQRGRERSERPHSKFRICHKSLVWYRGGIVGHLYLYRLTPTCIFDSR